MTEILDLIIARIAEAFGNNAYLTTFVISMIPMIEVRGAIPVATQMGMHPAVAYVFSAVSALVVCPILVFGLRPVLNAMKRTSWFKKLAALVEDLFRGKAQKIEQKAQTEASSAELAVKARRKRVWTLALGIFAFVAIPLPMTGVWTGSAIAAFIDLKPRYSIPAVVLGNFCASAIIALLTLVLGDKSSLILMILFIFVLISIVGLFVTLFIKRSRRKKQEQKALVFSDRKDENPDSDDERKDDSASEQ